MLGFAPVLQWLLTAGTVRKIQGLMFSASTMSFLKIWNVKYVIFAKESIVSQNNEDKSCGLVMSWCSTGSWESFISVSKKPTLQIKIYLTESGRNVHRRSDASQFYSCVFFLMLLTKIKSKLTRAGRWALLNNATSGQSNRRDKRSAAETEHKHCQSRMTGLIHAS